MYQDKIKFNVDKNTGKKKLQMITKIKKSTIFHTRGVVASQ